MEMPWIPCLHLARWCALAVIFAGAWLSAQAQPHMVATHHGAIMPPPEAPGLSPDPAKLFANGEEFSYDIYWGIFEVGHADWYVWTAHNANGEATLRSILNVRTNPAVDLFYRVRANSTTWATPTLDRSLQYSTQQDDSYRLRNAQMIFDVKKSLVTEKVTMAVAPGAHRRRIGHRRGCSRPPATRPTPSPATPRADGPDPTGRFPAYGGGSSPALAADEARLRSPSRAALLPDIAPRR